MKKTPELYDRRNAKKKYIEFWRYREGANIGNEISKDGKFKRPCLIMKTNTGNGLILIAPITTKYHENLKHHYIPINNYIKYGLKESWIIKNQIKMIDRKRIAGVIGLGKKHRPFSKFVVESYISFLQQ